MRVISIGGHLDFSVNHLDLNFRLDNIVLSIVLSIIVIRFTSVRSPSDFGPNQARDDDDLPRRILATSKSWSVHADGGGQGRDQEQTGPPLHHRRGQHHADCQSGPGADFYINHFHCLS